MSQRVLITAGAAGIGWATTAVPMLLGAQMMTKPGRYLEDPAFKPTSKSG